jgi:tetratricopeptide (TPR) repeat protein
MDPDASRRPSLGPIIAELDRLLGRTRRRAIAGGLVVTALVGAAAAGFVGSEGPRCPQPNQAIAELWEESIRADLGERLTGRQWEALSDYAQEWATLRVGRCNATWSTGERTPSQLEATNACLGRARARFQAVTQTLASGSQMQLHRASEVVEELYSIDPCAQDEPGNTVPPPHLQIDVERIRAQLERAHTSKVVGPLPDAIAQIEQVVEAARALGFEPLVAEAWVELAGARNALPDPERAEVAASAALELAERHGLAQVRFDAWSERLLALGRQGRYGEALHLLRAAEASLHALPDPRGARAELLAFSGRLHAHVDDPATACKLLEQARAELEALHGSHSVELLGTLTGLTDCRVGLGEIDRARAYAQRALDLARAGLEPGDRRIATALHELAQQDLLAMDFQSALDRSSEAIEVLERTHGPASPALHMPLDIAARAASYQGHHAQAIEFIDRAVRVTASGEPRSYLRSLRQAAFIRVEVAKEERPEARAKLLSEAEGLLDRSEAVVDDLDDPEYERARLHDYRGILFAAGDRWPQAVEATTMALEVYERRGRALAIGPALIARAEAHRNLGDYDAAINDLLAARDGGLATGDRRFRVFAQRNLALVLHEAGRSRQAREQARAALEGYETYPELEREASSAELHQILGSRRAGAGRPGPITPAD